MTTTTIAIQILGDLHLESPGEGAYDLISISAAAPHLALVGDIGNTKDPGLFRFLRAQLENFQTVFYLFGNHEPYHTSWGEARSKIREFEDWVDAQPEGSGLGRFVFMNKTRFDLSPTVTVLGCTLYSNIPDHSSELLQMSLNDFYLIDSWTVKDHVAAHNTDLAWLNEQVSRLAAEEPQREIIILTHHSPTLDVRAVNPKYGVDGISSGFRTDLSLQPCWTGGNVKAWVFGHTHYNCDFFDESTGKRVVANQRGYYSAQAPGFEVQKVVCVGGI